MSLTATEIDVTEIRAEALRLADQSYKHDGLKRTEVLALLHIIGDLLAEIDRLKGTAKPH